MTINNIRSKLTYVRYLIFFLFNVDLHCIFILKVLHSFSFEITVRYTDSLVICLFNYFSL